MSTIKIRLKLLLVLAFHGTSTTGFVFPRKRTPAFAALQNAYLDALDNIPSNQASAAFTFDNSGDFPRQPTPAVEVQPPIEMAASSATSPIIPPPPKEEPSAPTPVVEVMPMDPPTNGTNGASTPENKSSYDNQRQKYEGDFLKNSQTNSFRTSSFSEDPPPREEPKDPLAPVVEVLPRDHPYQEEDSRLDHLAVKNLELEQANSRLEQENERQRFELESFLRNSMSDPLYPRLPMEDGDPYRDPFESDELVENNSRLQSENERQRQDLEAFEEELRSMENVIQSIEGESFENTERLREQNSFLKNENERQREQLEAFRDEFDKMKDIIQNMRDESMTLQNEKQLFQNEKNLLETRLKGADNDNERKISELNTFQKQMEEMEIALQSLKDEKTNLQNEKEELLKEKTTLDTRLVGTEDDFQRQRYELDAYKKDRASMETLVQSIRDESTALQNEKTRLESTVVEMSQNMQNLSQQLANSQEQFKQLNSDKDKYVFESNEAYRQLQLRFQETLNESNTLKSEKLAAEKRMENAEAINEKQLYELESYRRERGNMENMIKVLQEETTTLKGEKDTMETTMMNMRQTLKNLEQQLNASTEELSRLRSENKSLLKQSTQTYETYNELQIQFDQVMEQLRACENSRGPPGGPQQMPMGGVEDFRDRINNRRQNQMRRTQTDDDANGWWN